MLRSSPSGIGGGSRFDESISDGRLMLNVFKKPRWALLDCLTGEWNPVSQLPFEIGSDEGVDLRLNGVNACGKHCALALVKDRGLCLVKRDDRAAVLLNGLPAELEDLALEQDYSLQIGAHLLLLRGSKELERWRAQIDHTTWSVYHPDTEESVGPWPLTDLCRMAKANHWSPLAIAVPTGATMGFHLRQFPGIFGAPIQECTVRSAGTAVDPPTEEGFICPGDKGALTCPVCWLTFDLGDIMHVAVHDSLRGDPLLGQDASLRFHATQFNDRGQALDAFGLPCADIACPHCRRILPSGFTEVKHHILSIVGDQSAGKSYYLSVLIKLLPIALYRHFGVTFYDADPAGNAMLNEMKKTLFSAQSPEEARLVKTQLEGAMYERLPRYGRIVPLPKPFVFYLHSVHAPEQRCSAIFYDNAGEHFQPGRDSADSPGAQHVASSSGILFLFDPFNHPEFRKSMNGQPDPQLERPVLDQQDIILSELKVRVKKLRNLGMAEKIEQPFAVLAGKCDAWMHRLGANPFVDPVRDGRLDLASVRQNSEKVRSLMLEIAPAIVANAEGISRNVLYFPVSSFGHPPVKIGSGDYVPDPRQLRPILVEVPVLWILSQVRPELVPVS